jgi:hypothetical protein
LNTKIRYRRVGRIGQRPRLLGSAATSARTISCGSWTSFAVRSSSPQWPAAKHLLIRGLRIETLRREHLRGANYTATWRCEVNTALVLGTDRRFALVGLGAHVLQLSIDLSVDGPVDGFLDLSGCQVLVSLGSLDHLVSGRFWSRRCGEEVEGFQTAPRRLQRPSRLRLQPRWPRGASPIDRGSANGSGDTSPGRWPLGRASVSIK